MSSAVIGIGATVALGVGAAGAAASAYGAHQQAGAAKNAQNISQGQYGDTVARNAPFTQAGYESTDQLNYLMGQGGKTDAQGKPISSSGGGYGSLLTPFTAKNFHDLSPAYGFQLQQGQQGVLNSDTSTQGALSGAAQKDLIGYSQNMANTSFNNAFNQYQTQQGNIYSRLAGVAGMGQASANNTASQGTALAGQAAQSAQNVGNAYANGANGIAGSLGNGAQTAALWSQFGGGGSQNTTPSNYTGASGSTINQGGYLFGTPRAIG